ncbi:MAG TPA: AgmX/PglI C-terminal domain-containing protein [Steroidobacteraceae bacterium]|nr:AgmX/PglI C-terminal domain-containing protein [Steroidobacteraceae bacterium]
MTSLAPFYREYDLPWEGDDEGSQRFRKILRVMLVLFVLFAILFAVLPPPKRTASETEVPQRLARVMIENKPKPPPPPPPVPKVEEKPKVAVEKKPVPLPPVDRKQVAHEKAQKSLNQVKDELADLREQMDLTPLAQTKNLSGAVGADSHAERALITSKVGAGSGGITSANSSRGFGTGAGSLTGHDTTAVTSQIARSGLDTRGPTRTGNSGKAARSHEEIELVFDRNKGAIYALYSRELRERPELQGKLVLELTIAPGGDVTMCRVVSSDLSDPELEKKIVARVRLFRFEAKDVESITTTKPLEFFPG